MSLFGRIAEIEIRPSFGIPIQIKCPPLSCDLFVSEGLRQTGTLRIFNPSQDTIEKAQLKSEGSGWKGAKVIVKAGHSKSLKPFFEGSIFSLEESSANGDASLDLQVSDETIYTGQKLIQRSFSKLPLQGILEALLPEFGLSRGTILIRKPGIHTLAFATVNEALTYFANLDGHIFRIVNNSLSVYPNSLRFPPKINLSNSNILEINRVGSGYRVVSVFQPNLHPTEEVTLESSLTSGVFQVQKTNHYFTTSVKRAYSEAILG